MKQLTQKEQFYYKEALMVLEYFNKDTSRDTLYLTDGGNSVIMKSDNKFSDQFIGHSINSIVEYVAEVQGKKTEWI